MILPRIAASSYQFPGRGAEFLSIGGYWKTSICHDTIFSSGMATVLLHAAAQEDILSPKDVPQRCRPNDVTFKMGMNTRVPDMRATHPNIASMGFLS